LLEWGLDMIEVDICDPARSVRAGASGEARDRRVADLYHHGIYGIGSRLGTAYFAAGKKALVAEDWNAAIAVLKLAALRDPRNADIQNYIGYAYRRCANWARRCSIIRKPYCSIGVTAAPTSHLGELYLVLGDRAKAAA
jgi:tetratricopeptide (TPR) repeat protein